MGLHFQAWSCSHKLEFYKIEFGVTTWINQRKQDSPWNQAPPCYVVMLIAPTKGEDVDVDYYVEHEIFVLRQNQLINQGDSS